MNSPNPLNRPHKLQLIKDVNGQYRWRRRAGNSRIISNSGESYVRREGMIQGLKLANADWDSVQWEDLTGDYDKLPEETDPSPSS